MTEAAIKKAEIFPKAGNQNSTAEGKEGRGPGSGLVGEGAGKSIGDLENPFLLLCRRT